MQAREPKGSSKGGQFASAESSSNNYEITKADQKTIRAYASIHGNEVRRAMYDVLAGDPLTNSTKREAAAFIDLVSKAKASPGKMYRGMSLTDSQLNEFTPGKEIEVKIPSSWSKSQTAAQDFAYSRSFNRSINLDKRVLMVVESKTSHVAIHDHVKPEFKWMQETVNRPRARYRIVRREKRTERWTDQNPFGSKGEKDSEFEVIHLEEM